MLQLMFNLASGLALWHMVGGTVSCHEQSAVTQVPLIDLQPWYSYVLKTERPEAPEGEVSTTPLRAGPSYVPEQPVTVSLLMEIGKEIMSLYGKTGAALHICSCATRAVTPLVHFLLHRAHTIGLASS